MVTLKDAVIEAVTQSGKVVTTREVIDRIYSKYPDRPWKENSISCHLIGLSVNHPSAKHYPGLCRHACFFSLGHGRYRLLKPEDDIEAIATDKNADDGTDLDFENIEDYSEAVISLEKDLEDFLVRNMSQLEEGLDLYKKERMEGRQFNTDVGRIDLLATDNKGNLVIIEIKAGTAKDSVVGQILGYMSWVTTNLAQGKGVRGIIVADDFDVRVKYAASTLPNIELKEYKVKFSFSDVKL